jgi:hypothetical protein
MSELTSDPRFTRIPLEIGQDGAALFGEIPPGIAAVVSCESSNAGLLWALGAPSLFLARALLARVLINFPRAARNPNGLGAMMMDTSGGGGLVFWRIKPLTPAAADWPDHQDW